MAAKDDLKPLIDAVVHNMSSNEFTSFDFMMAFARFQEKAFVKALNENLNHPAGAFAAVREVLEKLLAETPKASKLRDGARGIDMFGLPGTTIMWQRKA